jgi:hypothetical protein
MPNRCATPGNGERGRDDEERAHDHDAAEVASDRPQRRREALPEQHDRQEQQQHRLWRQLDLPQRRHEAKREPEDQQKQRHGDPEPRREHCTGEDGDAEHHRDL